MRTQYRKKYSLMLLVALFASLSITSCTGSTTKEKPLEISKINAVDYPNTVGSFFHLDDSFKELFNQNIHNKPLRVVNDNESVDEYTLYPQRNQKIPNRTILLVDNSYSMKTENAMEMAKQNLTSFIQLMTIEDEVMIVTFNTDTQIRTLSEEGKPVFLSDKTELFSIIDSLTYETKNTALFDSIYFSLDLFDLNTIFRQNNVVVFTDLAETSQQVKNTYTAKQCQELASAKGINVFTIVYGNNIVPSFRDNIQQLASVAYYTDQSSEIQTIFQEISSDIYSEDLLYGISTLWFLDTEIPDQDLLYAKELLTEYVNHCVSKDLNGLFSISGENFLQNSIVATNNLADFFHSVAFVESKENDPEKISKEQFEELLHYLADTPNSAKNMVFITTSPSSHLISLLRQNSEFATKSGISFSFIHYKDDISQQKGIASLANKTAGFVQFIPENMPMQEASKTVVNQLQGEYYLSFPATKKNTLLNIHHLKLTLAENEEVGDGKTYFVGFITTTFKNSPYFNVFIWILLFILICLIVGFLFLQNKSKKTRNTKDNSSQPIFQAGIDQNDIEETVLLDVNRNATENNNTVLIRKKPTKGISWITVLKGDLRGKSYTIKEEEHTTIGRKSDCDVSIPDTSLSSHHATIYKKVINKKPYYYIKDMVSTNQTKVNDITIGESVELHDNDIIICGEVVFVFKSIANSGAMQ